MIEDPRVTALDDHYYKGSLNFDQFVLGATLAASAYLAQTQRYAQLGWNEETLLLLPLLVLVLSAWLGFKRIAWTIHLLKMNARYLELCAGNPGIDFSKVLEATKEIGDKTGFFYRWRNRTIFLAFACHIGVKLASTYPIF
ncbi:hypothetical protein [Pseudomonas aeruginosa]|jgi:hypothetical protein|uniref:hypothetical protein n=1 Tax=Pseudomonas aeruginosa TaxID=287 RepID=UPI0003B97BB3|nr:hypothetical protein [Pseudomonas aeruginosa]EVT82794.1 hypothetical protein Z046_31740 [Pseudomonas aeruginosa VRFPA09]ARH12908.1 hypothetical protein HW07_29955 [Pseudomonas aeruginosa]AVN42382.1 hypothetical protein AM474_02415 [Pseudomonas aeruginosa]EIU1412002.1 hypothetical protein [Pseudomonas aeruginosa]EKU5566723.1 hypothetical protein [Pseudomonas aeruginosa]